MDKLDGKTANIIDENIQKLKQLFPEAFNEEKVDFEMLQRVLGENVETEKERYSFNWNGKSEAIKIALKQSTGTLRPDKESSKNWDDTQNLYIEGDNLEVLRILQSSYRNKIKMIYIDPPYNTGKDFVYSDKFNDTVDDYKERVGEKYKTNANTSGRYHTNWLNMMYPRLKLAKNLLTEDGVIFVSIGVDESVNLAKICDEIFGEENRIGITPVIMNLKGNQDAYGFAETHDYVLVYAKSKTECNFGRLPVSDEDLNNWLEDEYGLYKIADNLRATGINAPRIKRPNLWYPIFVTSKEDLYTTSDNKPMSVNDAVVWPINPEGEELSWYWSKNTFNDSKQNLIIKHTSNGTQFYRKQRPQLNNSGPTKKPKSVLFKPEYSTSTATIKLKKIMGGKFFDTPKPVLYIKDLLSMGSSNSSTILDFFSGSASTAHAIMKLNSEDGGDRKFIMVQLPEETDEKSEARNVGYETIADIGRERIRRAGEKILEENKEELLKRETPLDVGFKAFKLDTTNLSVWDEKTDNLEQTLLDNIEAIKKDRIDEDVLYEVLLKYGVDITLLIEEEVLDGKKLYKVAGGYLTICLEDNLDTAFIEKLAERKPERVVFRDSGFKDDTVKVNAEMTLKKHGVEDIKVL